MKVTFESEDRLEINRLNKSLDMACFIFELTANTWREFKNEEVDHSPVFDRIYELLEENSIDIEDLIE